MLETVDVARLEAVLRSFATAARSLRLYPSTSPIPLQSVGAVVSALETYFTGGSPVLALTVAREGFSIDGETVGTIIPGARELADELRAHGVAEIDLMPGATAQDLLAFLSVMARPAEDVRAEGGLAALTAAAGVVCVRVTDIQLTVIEQTLEQDPEDMEGFLRELGADSDKFATWFAAASAGDPAAFKEGLLELERVAGAQGAEGLLNSLTTTFLASESDGRDALMNLAMDSGGVRDLVAQMFGRIGSPDIAGSILGGTFGKNMLSLSSALTNLPLEKVTAEVRAEVQALLPGTGHTAREASFLDHMLEVRSRIEPEPALVDADRTFQAVLQAASLSEEDIARERGAVATAGGELNAAGVRTMITLLDQQEDFELYCAGAENLAGVVPRLIEQGDLHLAARVLTELSNREARDSGPWPELSGRLRTARVAAAGPRSMQALVAAVIADPDLTGDAREIVRHAGDAGGPPLVAEAISRKADGIAIAEALLGRRVIDLLNTAAPSAQWYQLGPIVTRLVTDGSPHSIATVEALMRRPDDQSRREVATALGGIGGPASVHLLKSALRDTSPEVAIVAARAIARSGEAGSAALLSSRLGELDIDNADFLVAKELIGALARTPEPAADEALAKLASRRSLMKRGHFSDIQVLVGQAQSARRGGVGR